MLFKLIVKILMKNNNYLYFIYYYIMNESLGEKKVN